MVGGDLDYFACIAASLRAIFNMLRITIEKNSRGTTFRLEGRLMGPWVEELGRVWRSALNGSSEGCICVDLSDVTFVGEDGKSLLEQMHGQGAKLKTSRCATRGVVDEIDHAMKRASSL